ncbi:disease resistance protein Roq1-like [Rhodamnia argentea]|uniref:Disease resistance protein Roq1-like n=1 Tax=Rhodamnia argentea TaxID=178133 RepID=A0ABM3H487_9MYRT|nr:disease resistance protein Roq1-like [Rhodamnia argentea]
MGGIGKTTLAKAIYNKLTDRFENRSFIADIRESWKRNGAHYVQNQLIYDILKRKAQNEDEGAKYISSNFKGKKVLLLLDDVDDDVQLKRLAGNRDWFFSGSMVIITTRDERILQKFGVDYAYEHKEMDKYQSLILFSKHAFQRDSPPRDFDDLTQVVVSTTGGLPLTLEVLGSLLCKREPAHSRSTIDKLKKVPHKEVQKKLWISYEVLEYEQQQIFLDIACFFIGFNRRTVSYMWDACGFFPDEGIEVLRSMSLIKVGDDHKFRMHDQLRDLGREIVREENRREPRNRSRLWDFEEVEKVLKKNKGTEKIEAIFLSKGSSEGSGKAAERDGAIHTEGQFKKLTGLRFLHVEGAHLSGDFEDSVEGLTWLRWPNCPANFEVKNYHATELVVLELSRSKINESWQGWSSFMMAKKLKFLDLSHCESLEDTNFLSAFKNLEVLILRFCGGLQQIDSSIGDMKALLRLELCFRTSLTELPAEIGKLRALEQLLPQHTRALSALPDSIGRLQNLDTLNISWSGVRELPSSIGRLRKLRHLDASCCRDPQGEMPESMGSLENLEILNISEAGVEELPIGIGRLRKLRDLDASYCKNLRGEMTDRSIGGLSCLQRLDFCGCEELQSLPDLPSSLTYLDVTCRSRRLPSLSRLTHLKELRVSDCEFLECIQEEPTDVEQSELPQSKLEVLEIGCCPLIETLDVSRFNHLRTLSADSCHNLIEVRGLDKLIHLESLTINCCDSIERLDLPKSEGLKRLVGVLGKAEHHYLHFD